MAVDIDEPRRDREPLGLKDELRLRRRAADLHDPPARDRDVGLDGRCARAVMDRAAADEKIVCHGYSAACRMAERQASVAASSTTKLAPSRTTP